MAFAATSTTLKSSAHATRVAHPTTSSRRAAVRRPRACPARYDAGRFVRPVTICELAGECTDRDRLTLVAQDRPGRRACAHKVTTAEPVDGLSVM